MGILNSKGDYIMNLDPDDELEGKDNLKYLYDKVLKYRVDVISFASLFKINNKICIKCSNFHKILRYPKILKSAFNSTNILNDYLIWNKLIKRELFIKAYNLFIKKIYSEKWNFHEDNIWSILILKNAKSMICIKKIIYIYYSNSDSAMLNKGNILELKNLIYRHEMFVEIFKERKELKFILAEILEFLYIISNNENFIYIIKKKENIKKKIIN